MSTGLAEGSIRLEAMGHFIIHSRSSRKLLALPQEQTQRKWGFDYHNKRLVFPKGCELLSTACDVLLALVVGYSLLLLQPLVPFFYWLAFVEPQHLRSHFVPCHLCLAST